MNDISPQALAQLLAAHHERVRQSIDDLRHEVKDGNRTDTADEVIDAVQRTAYDLGLPHPGHSVERVILSLVGWPSLLKKKGKKP